MSLILLGILNSQAEAAGGAGAFDLLETQVLTGSAASVTFTGLGSYSDYKHLQIRMTAQHNFTGLVANLNLEITANSDVGTNYRNHYLNGDGTSVTSSSGLNEYAEIYRVLPGAFSQSGNIYGAAVVDILDFASSNKNTTFRMLGGALDPNDTSEITFASTGWFNTNSVTSLGIAPGGFNFSAGSRFSLYGIR